MENYASLVQEAAEQAAKGLFLMAGEGTPNPMTIGWAQWGRIWNMPVCTVMVRKSRFSYEKLMEYPYFTVSVPAAGEMGESLAYCGTKSGRDGDKLSALGLSLQIGKAGKVPALSGCALHFECRVVMRLAMDEAALLALPPEAARFYNPAEQAGTDGDPHVLFFGEILSAYREK